MLANRLQLAFVAALTPAVLATVFVAAPDAAGGTRSCKQAKSKTIAQNRHLRVFRVERRNGDEALYACRRSTGRRAKLDEISGDDVFGSSYRNVRLAGVYVAWESVSISDDGCRADCPGGGSDPESSSIEVYSGRSNRQRTVAGEPLGRALVLSRRGAVAWAAQGLASVPVEIHGSVRRGDDRVLDLGNIEPKSLAIEISIISWKRDGREYFARLR